MRPTVRYESDHLDPSEENEEISSAEMGELTDPNSRHFRNLLD